MPASERSKIIQHWTRPRIVELWQALAPLQSVVSLMSSGAHPDDEKSAMLAALGLRDGLDLSYACSTRGEGGQNDIGSETGAALGVLRTAEMEQACDVLNLTQYWLSEQPDDAIADFGFSKSGDETLRRWGSERTLRRFVEIVRSERPDILCPTFLNVPGQHGHHRAMTDAAHQVMALAADPAFDTDQSIWQVKKLYLPAWSGAGQAYDDDLPPPAQTLCIDGSGRDPVTGFSYARIGQQSRVFHRTQGMGRWLPPDESADWPLHLAVSYVNGPDVALCSGLAATLDDLGLAPVQRHFDAARVAFPNTESVLAEVSAGLAVLQVADVPDYLVHKVHRKIVQASRAIRLAAGIELDASLDRNVLQNGDQTSLSLSMVSDVADAQARVVLPDGWRLEEQVLSLESALPSDAMPAYYQRDDPPPPCIEISVTSHGVRSHSRLPLIDPPIVLPERRAVLAPQLDIINLKTAQRRLKLEVDGLSPTTASPSLQVPDGWTVTADDAGLTLAFDQVEPGRYRFPLLLDGEPAQSTQIIGSSYDHVPSRALSGPASMQVQVIDCALPDARIAYIGSGNDQVDHWLARAGFNITAISVEELGSSETMAGFDALIVGILAMKFRPGLSQAMSHVHRWVEAGGNLLTLYHRPWDNWDPEATPPARIEIGQPSLRWRITDEESVVTHLADHPILLRPNPIGAADWQGWHKERGLYFAKQWDARYTPLIEMADPGEAPLQGALLNAQIGAGQHSHCALNLHYQLACGVAGAYRLMANLLAVCE